MFILRYKGVQFFRFPFKIFLSSSECLPLCFIFKSEFLGGKSFKMYIFMKRLHLHISDEAFSTYDDWTDSAYSGFFTDFFFQIKHRYRDGDNKQSKHNEILHHSCADYSCCSNWHLCHNVQEVCLSYLQKCLNTYSKMYSYTEL